VERPAPENALRTQGRRTFLQTAIGAVGYWALAGCGGGGSSSAPQSPAASAQLLASTNLLPVSADAIANIRARPETFLDAYGALATANQSASEVVQARLGAAFASLSDAGSMATFATLLAYNCAPVGATPLAPIPATLQQLLSSEALACGHFCKLTTMLSLLGHPELIPPDADPASPPKPTVHFVVWIATVPLNTGLHSQLVLANVLDNAYLLLDPTYAYALRIPFVGAGPKTTLTVIENAATMLQTPIAEENLVILNPSGTAATPQMLPTLLSGAVGPGYIQHDSLYGSEGWDIRIAQIFDSIG
jgi:hypothetical protein